MCWWKPLLICFSPQCLPYSLLLQQLELKNVRELEDLLIEAVYCDIIQGKLDQRNQQVEVDCSVGRDLGPNELPNIINTLQEWSVFSPCVRANLSDSSVSFHFSNSPSISTPHDFPLLGVQGVRQCFVVLRSRSPGQTNTERVSWRSKSRWKQRLVFISSGDGFVFSSRYFCTCFFSLQLLLLCSWLPLVFWIPFDCILRFFLFPICFF